MSFKDTLGAAGLYRQSIAGCLDAAIGAAGLGAGELSAWTAKLARPLEALKSDYETGSLPLLNIPDETADIDAATAALARLSDGASTIVFYGTGGSGLGGETLAQIAGWGIPGGASPSQRSRPRIRFFDNLDPVTQAGVLGMDLEGTRFVVTSKSGGTAETLAQVITTLSALEAAGLGNEIRRMFLGVTEPEAEGRSNGLRALFRSLGIPMLEHHTGIGGRFSCLTNVGLLPALARGLDARAIRGGAREVVQAMLAATSPADFAPAVGAASMVALAKTRGVRTLVMMPYADRLGKFAEWFVQLWAESLGKKGEGTTPVPALGPLDQHSQLQHFMEGPRELALTILRVATRGKGPVIDARLARIAGSDYMAGKTIGDVVEAQSLAIAEALAKAGRPVRTIDIDHLDERTTGALLMHFMLETILAGRLLGVDPFDQPGVELAKALTRERLL
jgi:glucose-6-phosphate isomerase